MDTQAKRQLFELIHADVSGLHPASPKVVTRQSSVLFVEYTHGPVEAAR